MSDRQSSIDLLNKIEFYGKVVELDDLLSQVNYWQNSDKLSLDMMEWLGLHNAGEVVESIMKKTKART